jgi:beta-lactam-binding protein with PASTA domain
MLVAALPTCQSGRQVVVPDVQGETIVAAASAVQALGLCVFVEQGHGGLFHRPVVARQDPGRVRT